PRRRAGAGEGGGPSASGAAERRGCGGDRGAFGEVRAGQRGGHYSESGLGSGTTGVAGSSGWGTVDGSSGSAGVPGSGTAGVTGASGTTGVEGSVGCGTSAVICSMAVPY